jgi:hypothetical protein
MIFWNTCIYFVCHYLGLGFPYSRGHKKSSFLVIGGFFDLVEILYGILSLLSSVLFGV